MVKGKYPNQILVKLREEAADARARELREQVEREREAHEAKARSELALRTYAEQTEATARAEALARTARPFRASDMVVEQAWLARRQADEQELEHQVATETDRAHEATVETAKARAAVAEAKAEERVIHRHRERFQTAVAARQEASAESEIEDRFGRRR
jgi:hypothetical protein